jgi:hypothetical protein
LSRPLVGAWTVAAAFSAIPPVTSSSSSRNINQQDMNYNMTAIQNACAQCLSSRPSGKLQEHTHTHTHIHIHSTHTLIPLQQFNISSYDVVYLMLLSSEMACGCWPVAATFHQSCRSCEGSAGSSHWQNNFTVSLTVQQEVHIGLALVVMQISSAVRGTPLLLLATISMS